MGKFYTLLIAILFFWNIPAIAQETICGDGIDNDKDGFVDCYDSDCAGSTACKDFFMGAEAGCEAKPTEAPTFSLAEAWKSADQTAASWSRPSIGDLDGNGIPEVVVTNRITNTMTILSGLNGTTIQQIKLPFNSEGPEHGVALGDIDADGYAEIFVSGRDRGILAYKYNPTTQLYNTTPMWKDHSKASGGHEKGRPVVLGLADFNEDGKAELYYKNEIRDALTGTRLINGTGNWEKQIAFAPVAVDILPEYPGLELVSGGVIYSVNLGNGTVDNGSLTERKKIPDYFVKYYPAWDENWSSSSVADFNQDGYLDVIASGAVNSNTGTTTVFFWDVFNNTVKTYAVPGNNGQGTGRLNIADIDGNGQLNVTFVSGKIIFALDENFLEMWNRPINEKSSGFTGTTVFDFNGDGAYEIVYRDEMNLYIIDGNGTFKVTKACPSRTSSEYPVVADVDGDGATEICVVCNTDSNSNPGDNGNITQFAQVRTYKSEGESWVPSRKVWNQHTYFNVNINDNLTIPKEMQKHHIAFRDGDCSNNANITNTRPLNTFLNQSPQLKLDGCPAYGAPDFTIPANSLVITPPECPEENFKISFTVLNEGDIAVSGDVPVTFYKGNPTVAGSKRLNTLTVEVRNLLPGGSMEVKDLIVQGDGSEFDLYVSFNDKGTLNPVITSFPSQILECLNNDNLANKKVSPNPFAIKAVKIKDHQSCEILFPGSTPTVTPNGVAEAYLEVDGQKVTAGYTFYWYKSTDLNTVIGTGAIQTGLSDGTYTVKAEHDLAKCSSSTVEVVIGKEVVDYKLGIEVIDGNRNCKDANGLDSGVLKAYIYKEENGEIKRLKSNNFTFKWYADLGDLGMDDPAKIISTDSIATKLKTQTYYVKFEDLSTGCTFSGSESVPDSRPNISIQLKVNQHISRCDQPNAGQITATVSGTSNSKVIWYDIDGNSIGTGLSKSGLKAGTYYAEAVENGIYKCSSQREEIKIEDRTARPEFGELIVHNTACVNNLYNGKITLNPHTPSPGSEPASGYSVSWYKGPTTSSPLVPSANYESDGLSLKNLAPGTYTARLTNPDSKCERITQFTIEDKPIILILSEDSQTANTVCEEDNLTKFTGKLKLLLHLDNDNQTDTELDNYTIKWRAPDGSSVTPTTGSKGLEIEQKIHGKYTVTATHTLTGCTVTEEFNIKDERELPELSLTPTHVTSCSGTSNGKIEPVVKLNGQPITSGFTIEWQDENGNTPATSGFSAIELEGEKTYKAIVTMNGSNCKVTEEVFLKDDSTEPKVDIISGSKKDNTVCDPSAITPAPGSYNGAISLSITDAGTNYTVRWDSVDATGTRHPIPGYDDQLTASNLKEGTYKIVVTNTDLSCTSQDLDFKILKSIEAADPDITMVPQTSCDPLSPNGQLTVQMKDAAGINLNNADYTFSWTDANGATLAAANISGNDAIGLVPGTYILTATSKASGCTYTSQATVTENKVIPVVSLTPTHIPASCSSTPNGSITASLSVGSLSDYTFHWYDKDGQELNQTGPTLTAWAGTYSVIAEHKTLKCKTIKKSETINPPASPYFTVDYSIVTLPSSCASSNGEIKAWVIDGSQNTTDYDFEWYEGRATNPPATYYTNPQVTFANPSIYTGATISNRETGIYTVVAINKTTGCKEFKEIKLPYVDAQEVELAATVIGVSECTNNPDGKISVQIDPTTFPTPNPDPVTGATYDQTDYEYYLFEGSNPSNDLNDAIQSPKRSTDPTTGIAFENLEAGYYSVVAVEKISGNDCQSVSISVEIPQIAKPPVVDFQTPVASTQCSGGNGSITFSVKPATDDTELTNFTYAIKKSTDGTIAEDENGSQLTGNGTADNSQVSLNGLISGSYVLVVTGDPTNCIAEDIPFEIYDQRVEPSMQLSDITVINQSHCDPDFNGSITVNNISLGSETFVASNYTFEWFKKESTGAITSLSNTSSSLTNLEAGTYRVKATKNVAGDGYGCSVTKEITVGLDENELEILFTESHNSNCADFNGSLDAAATINGNPLSAGSTYEWFKGNQPTVGNEFQGTVSPNGQRIEGLEHGWYTLRVTDHTTSCPVTKSFEIKNESEKPLITKLEVEDQTYCSPNGRLKVTEITHEENGVTTTYNETNWGNEFTFSWFNEATGSPINTPATDPHILPGLAAGKYSVVVTKANSPGKSCVSAKKHQEIQFKDPVLNLTLTATHNNSCSLPNGRINAAVSYDMGDILAADLEFSLTGGALLTSVVLNSAGSPGSVNFNDLADGTYKVTVKDAHTGCEILDKEVIILNQPPTIQIGTPLVVHQDICNPSGSITINSMAPNDNNYTYTWYRDSYDENNPALGILEDANGTPINGPVLDATYPSMGAGIYYVVATRTDNPGLSCSSAPTRVEVLEEIEAPRFEVETIPVTACQGPGNGSISVEVFERAFNQNITANCTFSWFLLPDSNDPNNRLPISGSSSIASGLNAGTYLVEVYNGNTGCTNTLTREIIEDPIIPGVVALATNINDCEADNGKLFANLMNLSEFEANNPGRTFRFYWYSGWQNAFPGTGSEIATTSYGEELSGLSIGRYTVFAVEEQGGLGCVSAPEQLEIKEVKEYPQPTARMDAQVTICDPERPNGQASADVNGDYINYIFRWYKGGRNAVSANNFITENIIAPQLAAGTYTVEAIDKVTGCAGYQEVIITDSPSPIYLMEDEVLVTDVTSCSEPNGMLTVSVAGETSGYTFHWFQGEEVNPALRIDGSIMSSLNELPAGPYTVYAVDDRTGCATNPVTKVVNEQLSFPDIKIETTAATCGEPNGTATLIDLNGNVSAIRWSTGGASMDNLYQVSLPAGTYSVTATTIMGCELTREFTVPVDIKVFNGITDNNDGENDFFTIDCIENFANNLVQVYNRAGTLVYEAKGYNNSDKIFDGKGNKGIYLQGNKLPAGTYFYVINKNDGSKPTSGYLEIVR